MKKDYTPMILIILDGWGISNKEKGNAIMLGKTPTYDKVFKDYPHTSLFASGKYVGLPEGQSGNSEAGHSNLGAGRLVLQDSVIINKSIKDGRFFKNQAFLDAAKHVKKNKSKLHLMGVLSGEMSPHSQPGHILALLEFARRQNIKDTVLHLFTDGRDSYRLAGIKQMKKLEDQLKGKEKVGTVMGRLYLDRKKKWSRTKTVYDALVFGIGKKEETAQRAILKSYAENTSDEFMDPYIIGNDKTTRIKENDSVIFFNLRSDRARQLAKIFVQKDFNKMNKGAFKRRIVFDNLCFVAMTDFGPDLDSMKTAFTSVDLENTLPMEISNLKQVYMAETEKYAHVTYFFNGGYAKTVAGEDRVLIPSPNVKSYDKTPSMRAKELTKIILSNLHKEKYDFTVVNFSAPDMVGHTGNLEAAIQSCEKIDGYLKKIIDRYLELNGTVIVTADHGNVEEMIESKTGDVDTKHSNNKVPFIVINKKLKHCLQIKKSGSLSDVAPTILDLMGRSKPEEMTGNTLISSRMVCRVKKEMEGGARVE